MRRFYSGLAWAIAAGVVVQAAAIAFAFGGVLNRVSEGDVIDKALLESGGAGGTGELGFWIHAIGGAAMLPLLAAVLLVISFFVRAKGARLWATLTLALIVLQVVLGFSLTDLPYLGLIHGANALAVVAAAVIAAMRVRRTPTPPAEAGTRTDTEEATSNAVSA
ncbi:hypothetical protein ASE14_15485 [Agromyces sp. Root81]|uniref:hypothetical protein n=1 Tax=Agromyces sp. Root81 TaxID=1736601 RepID=UPI000701FE9C|nr:hypothetical protein [Agromyces sp. Root81]KRC59176.1 hypothetical protein ASE14_15485 [Agromyces sp. Root81]